MQTRSYKLKINHKAVCLSDLIITQLAYRYFYFGFVM